LVLRFQGALAGERPWALMCDAVGVQQKTGKPHEWGWRKTVLRGDEPAMNHGSKRRSPVKGLWRVGASPKFARCERFSLDHVGRQSCYKLVLSAAGGAGIDADFADAAVGFKAHFAQRKESAAVGTLFENARLWRVGKNGRGTIHRFAIIGMEDRDSQCDKWKRVALLRSAVRVFDQNPGVASLRSSTPG